MVIEDLHWLDPSTLELLQLLAGQGVMVRLMLICTARPEFHPQWPMRSHHTQITLNRLSGRNVREMVAQVAARNALNNQSIDAVIERTGGNPLFVEELTRAVLESGGIGTRAIPVTLHDSLMARLDRLGSAKSVLQLASVIGGEFSYELLHALHPGTESELESELHKLTDADLLYFRGIAPEATYQFKHALIRDAAYEALLKSRRKELHRLVARTIDEKFADLKGANPEVLARHWSEAGEIESAIAEWERAGKAAEARNAFEEAQTSYREALNLLSSLPGAPSRDAREMELIESLHRVLYVTKGLAAPESMDAMERRISLAEKTGNLVELAGSLNGKGFGAFFSGDLSGAIALADQALALALRSRNPRVVANVRFLQMAARCWHGDLACTQEHFTAGLEFFDDPDFRQQPGVVTGMFSVAAKNALMLGRPGASYQFLDRMTAIAEEKHAPSDLVLARLYSAMVRVDMREYKQAEALAAQALELSEKHQFANPKTNSQCVRGYARAQLGETSEGIALIRQGLGELPQVGTLGIVRYTTFLAEAQERAGMVEEALETIEQAISANALELSSRPEALRVRGELRLKQGQADKGGSDFQESIALAHKMGAKAWELRTTMSLARLLKSQGRRHEARTMLAEIYNWFTEGFDTADLKEAKVLLDELS
jgi:tetratricopeptide (TPR) repeat protein